MMLISRLWRVVMADGASDEGCMEKTITEPRLLVQPESLVFVDACRVFGISGLREACGPFFARVKGVWVSLYQVTLIR